MFHRSLAAGVAGLLLCLPMLAEASVRIVLLPLSVYAAGADTDYLSTGLAEMLAARLDVKRESERSGSRKLYWKLVGIDRVRAGFRWAFFGGGPFPGELVAISAAFGVILLAISLVVFQRVEQHFADVV